MRTLLLAFFLIPAIALAQDTPRPQPLSLQAELATLAAQAELLQHDLPRIACKEAVSSQLTKKSKVSQEVRLVAEVSIERNSHGTLTEHYDFQELNGSPYSGPQPSTPFFVEGAVAEGILFFLPSAQPFFTFTLSPGRLEYAFRQGASGQPPFPIPPSTHGFALLDANGYITHIERRADPKEANRARVTHFAAYDFSLTELNGKKYELASLNIAENNQGNESRRFEARISGCRLFHATTTILSGASPATDPPIQPEPHR